MQRPQPGRMARVHLNRRQADIVPLQAGIDGPATLAVQNPRVIAGGL
ncbi:MAG: hypothetical protein ACYDHM_14215 [Acidiferrobacterales bacterium]